MQNELKEIILLWMSIFLTAKVNKLNNTILSPYKFADYINSNHVFCV